MEEKQRGAERAEYGKHIIEHLSNELTHRYRKGFCKRYLAYFRKFYLTINDIEILQTCLQNLQVINGEIELAEISQIPFTESFAISHR